MTDFIHLHGAEDVQRAASSMVSAAQQMQRAADQIDQSLYSFREWAEELVTRLGDLK